MRLLLVFVLAGCSSGGTDLRIDVQTDWVPRGEFVRFRVWLQGPDGSELQPRLLDALEGTDYVAGANLTEYSVGKGRHEIRLQLLDATGLVLAERPVLTEVRGRTAVTITIARSCRGVTCPSGLACHGMRCVDARCAPENPEFCERSCDEVMCEPAAAACAGPPVCVTGVCLDSAGDCPEGEYCQPELGCLRLPDSPADASVDAGVPPDAGPNVDGLHVRSEAFGTAQTSEAVAIDAAGERVCIGGTFVGAIDFGGGPLIADFGDAGFVACFDSGVHAFSAVVESEFLTLDRLKDIHVSDSGELTVLTNLRGRPTFGAFTETGNFSYVVRFAADGTFRDALRLGEVGATVVGSVLEVMPTGSIVVGGTYRGTGGSATFGRDSGGTDWILPDTAAQSDAFVAMYDASMTVQWARSFGGPGGDNVTALAVDSSRVWAAGSFTFDATDDTGSVVLMALGVASDVFLIGYDASTGVPSSFVRLGGGAGADSAAGLVLDGDSLFLAGGFGGGDAIGACGEAPNYILGWDGPISDLSDSRCVAQLTGAADWRALDVGASGLVFGLESGTAVFDFAGRTVMTSGADLVLAGVGTDGTERWIQRYGSGVDHPRGLAIAGNAIHVVGHFSRETDFGGDVFVSEGESDVFLLELDD